MSSNDEVYRPPGAPEPTEPAYAEDGVDLTLIRWMLSLSPSGRLRQLQDFINAAERIWARNGIWNEVRTSKRS
jgi:hypothetical protein